jgi:hypothetical protein
MLKTFYSRTLTLIPGLISSLVITGVTGLIASAQVAPAKQWDVRYGGSGSDAMYVVKQTTDGGFILGGDSDSPASGDKTQGNEGSSDLWVVRTDATGVKLWDRRFGGSNEEQMFTVEQTTDGGFLLGGWSLSGATGDKSQPSQGASDFWILKTDLNGNKLWDAAFGGTADDELRSGEQTADGGYILGGESLSGISGNKTQASRGGNDYWMVKTDANGIKQWDARFGGTQDDKLNAIHQTTDGGYILGGWSQSGIGGDKTQASRGSTDYWIVKTDANGIKQWDARFGGSEHEYLYSVEQTQDGGYMLGGYSFSGANGDKTQPSQGGFDYWVVKTDANGIKQWDARFGGTAYDKLKAAEPTADGGYILGGWSESGMNGDKTQPGKGKGDYWVVKTDANGIKQWDAQFGGSGEEKMHSVFETSDGGFILGGYTYSLQSGDITEPSDGLNDYWIVKMQGSTPGTTYYADSDGDGYGNINADTIAFSQPAGYITDHSDCNDSNAGVHPGATDICNSIDDDCNFVIDDNAIVGSSTISPAGTTSACTGISVTLTANAVTGLSYQWIKNDLIIAGATSQVLSTTDGGTFLVVESNAFGCSKTSDPTIVNRISYPVPAINPAGAVSACSAVPVTLSANTDPAFTYQWFKGQTLQPGATNATFITTAAGDFLVKETASALCSATSGPTSITRIPAPDAVITPLGDLNICSTGSVLLQSNTGVNYTFQWKLGAANIAGATNQIYSASSVGLYRVTVTNASGCSKLSIGKKVFKSCKEGFITEANDQSHLSLFPNPASDHFTVNISIDDQTSGTAILSILNMLGQSVHEEKASVVNGGWIGEIDLKNVVADGMYLVRVKLNDAVFTERLELRH